MVNENYAAPDLIILDELGFTPLHRLLADAFYRIVASRYERSSTTITNNKGFEFCAEDFPDAVIVSAVLDRLVHLVPVVGESFRMKGHLSKRQKGAKTQKNGRNRDKGK